MPKIAFFERSDKMGGRLMSGYGALAPSTLVWAR